MKGFAGFPAGKQRYTRLPDLFFTDLLPAIDDLAELKLTLHVFWLLAQKKGTRPCLSRAELAADRRLLDGLSGFFGLTAEEALADALERAVARGTLLHILSRAGDDWYLANTEKGRQALDDLVAGRWSPAPGEPVLLEAHRPNIFVLYEQNIGPLTPLLVDQLLDAERTYPASWIEDAFRTAVEMNVRNWRYVRRILERWTAEGRDGEATRPAAEGDGRRYIEGPYADYIEH
jgi:DnaD/phage-associated family protein